MIKQRGYELGSILTRIFVISFFVATTVFCLLAGRSLFPEVAEAQCGYGELCHVNSRKANSVGSFDRHFLVERKKSSVILMEEKPTGEWKGFCSGTLIHPQVVLTASHCVPKGFTSTGKVAAVLHREYTAATADLLPESRRVMEIDRPWGRLGAVLERGHRDSDHDYALVCVNWVSPVPVNLPQPLIQFSSVTEGQDVLCIENPLGQPTQVSGGKVTAVNVPGPRVEIPLGTGSYAYAVYRSYPGSSGAGVFSLTGELVGVNVALEDLEASKLISHFLQLSSIKYSSPRLQKYSQELKDFPLTATPLLSEDLATWFLPGEPR